LTRVWLAAFVLVAVSFGAQAQPLSDATADAIRAAIDKNWNLPTGVPNMDRYTVSLRLHMTREGVVTQIDVLEDSGEPSFRAIADSARRAIQITQNEDGRLPIPAEEYRPTIILRWPMKLICEQRGGC
jgi:hypothetical protein